MTHHGEHMHPHLVGASLTPWALFVIFVFGPCEPLIPPDGRAGDESFVDAGGGGRGGVWRAYHRDHGDRGDPGIQGTPPR